MKELSGVLKPKERRELTETLLAFVARVSGGGYEIPGEAFTVLPSIVQILLEDDHLLQGNSR